MCSVIQVAHTMNSREHARRVLGTYIKQSKNVDILEKYISEYATDEQNYQSILYSIVYELQTKTEKTSDVIKRVMRRFYDKEIQWRSTTYTPFRIAEEEEDQFRITPFEIEEGVIECKCGSKRTISFQKQTRSADEGSTTFAQCVACGAKWRHNN